MRRPLEPDLERDTAAARQRRVQMQALDPLERLAREARQIEVVDVRYLRVEQVESLRGDPGMLRHVDPDLAVPDGRRLRLDARVLNQWAWSEVAKPNAAEDPPYRLDG